MLAQEQISLKNRPNINKKQLNTHSNQELGQQKRVPKLDDIPEKQKPVKQINNLFNSQIKNCDRLNQPQVCTKYNKCTMQNITKNNLNGNQLGSDDLSQFSIPSQILLDEQPLDLDIKPEGKFIGDQYIADLLVQRNLKQKALQQKQKKHREKLQQIEKIQRLKKINQKSRKLLEKCPKKPLSSQKRTQWNHSIYGQNSKQHGQGQQNKNQEYLKKQRHSQNKQNKVINRQIIPIKDRIINYKNKQKIKKQKNQEAGECDHRHSKQGKVKILDQKTIKQNAKNVLRKMRQEKKEKEDRTKAIKDKIKNIEIQSKKGLKKFKRKPVDQTIEFVVDLYPGKQNSKGAKTDKNQTITKNEVQNMQRQQSNRKYLPKKSHSISKTKVSNIDKMGNKTKNPGIQGTNMIENDLQQNNNVDCHPENTKFYLWDIPIFKEDLTKIENQQSYNQKFSKPVKNKFSFRQEVDQFLKRRHHERIQDYNKNLKQSKLNVLFEEKKRQILANSESQNKIGHTSNESQVLWNQDQTFKLSKIRKYDT